MSIFVEFDLTWTPASEALPSPGELVYYKTELYHFTGFRDPEGRWRNARGRVENHPVLAWARFAGRKKDESRM